MTAERTLDGLVRPVWWLVAVALVVGCTWWGSGIAAALGSSSPAAALPSPPPVPAVPTVVTEYSVSATLDRAQLCAELAPRVNTVIVENPLGYIDTTIQC